MDRAPYKSAKEGGGHSSTVSAFNHERAPTSCLQRLEALKANNWTQSNVQRNHHAAASKSNPEGTQHSELYDVTVSIITVARG